MKTNKWLITGGCGFIGTQLIQKLLEAGNYQIRVLDNLSAGNRQNIEKLTHFEEIEPRQATEEPLHNELIVGDIENAAVAEAAARGMNAIVHLAANTGVWPSVQNPREDLYANVIGTFNLLEAARTCSVESFIFASSGAPVGECEPPIQEEMAPHPFSPYGASKLSGEAYCSAYYRTFGVETVILRFSNVYGPGSAHKSSVIAKFIKQALNGQPLEIYGDGNQTRDFIHISDLIDAIILASEVEGIGGEIFQIASNNETTILKLANELASILSEKNIGGIRIIHGNNRAGDVKRNFSDTTKAETRLKWTNKFSLSEGLTETVNWFLDYYGT